eukprot:jgi/Picsp_1/4313/NSC_01821-R1_type a von willebrand factor domain-containing protein
MADLEIVDYCTETFKYLGQDCQSASVRQSFQRYVAEGGDAEFLFQVAKEAFLEPCNTIHMATSCRAIILPLIARIVEEMLGIDPSSNERDIRVPLALLQSLYLFPHTEREILRYFNVFGPPLDLMESVMDDRQVSGIDEIFVAQCMLLGMTSSTSLCSIFDWYHMLPLLKCNDRKVRWYGVKCFALSLGNSPDSVSNLLMQKYVDQDTQTLMALDWNRLRAKILAVEEQILSESIALSGQSKACPELCAVSGRCPIRMPAGYVNLHGLIVPRKGSIDCELKAESPNFVLTATQVEALQYSVIGLCLRRSLLLQGPVGSGKTVLVDYLASCTGNKSDMIHIYLNDQIDAKMMVGSYVCTSTPGQFRWAPGPLTRALRNGHWLVIENVNLASSEVLTLLSYVIKHQKLVIPSRGEEIVAQDGFQLIMTSNLSNSSVHPQMNILLSISNSIPIPEVKLHDRKRILMSRFGCISAVLHHMLLTVEAFTCAFSMSADLCYQLPFPFQSVVEKMQKALEITHFNREISFRDIIKWANRLASLHAHEFAAMPNLEIQDIGSDVCRVPLSARTAVLVEFLDCFCQSVSSRKSQKVILEALADTWAVPSAILDQHMSLSKPDIIYEAGLLRIGRAKFFMADDGSIVKKTPKVTRSFARTGASLRLLEQISAALCLNEPVLLVGETGTGKTTVIQEIANLLKKKLTVVNLSQQTDSSDLIGGFRPVQAGSVIKGLLPRYIDLVKSTWKRGDNEEFISRVLALAKKGKWKRLLNAFQLGIKKWDSAGKRSTSMTGIKRPREPFLAQELAQLWMDFAIDVEKAIHQTSTAERGFAFEFTEGILVKAFREGWWLLLDEINLAPTEVLERISEILDRTSQGLVITERGDVERIARHEDFRIFGAMNPATDAGKKGLPLLLRSRFTEFWVEEPNSLEDLTAIVRQHLGSSASQAPVSGIVAFYQQCKDLAESKLQDGAGVKPIYNLRTLSRALEYTHACARIYGIKRALLDGLAMSFQTQLDRNSSNIMDNLMQALFLTEPKGLIKDVATPLAPSPRHILFDNYWVESGTEALERDSENFVITPTVSANLKNLARAVLLKRYPILLQGPTSSGKTSLVTHLAKSTGHKCIRINNHEHTDIQEYLGTYISDAEGRLVFHEGPLVSALRHGHWIILDELNLAPTEVLEALNRLLDDNRELFVPELQEVVKPHDHFMLFATQNPPGIYAGRKILSRAFRSRFLELHIDDIPDDELHLILEQRCKIAPSHATKMTQVMRELQRRRLASNIFAGRHGFITPRDLFRWANRPAVGFDDLAINGFLVLGERLRIEEDRLILIEVLERTLKRKVAVDGLYRMQGSPLCQGSSNHKIIWTTSFLRIYSLLRQCVENNEPSLIIGDTGIGKTTACQLLAESRSQRLHILNCNQNTETSDFVGGYRPNKSKESHYRNAVILSEEINASFGSKLKISSSSDLNQVLLEIRALLQNKDLENEHRNVLLRLQESISNFFAPFEWVDGPLVTAMKHGDLLLIDELNLAEDAVLERLNSVLESHKSLTLSEKIGREIEVVEAQPSFQVIATMNPGGDFGKKELSPALMNRFTVIWAPSVRDEHEMASILEGNLPVRVRTVSRYMVDFWSFFAKKLTTVARHPLSIRDMLSWADFIANCIDIMTEAEAFWHGAHASIIDGLGLGSGLSEKVIKTLREEASREVLRVCLMIDPNFNHPDSIGVSDVLISNTTWGIYPFFIELGVRKSVVSHYTFRTVTTASNLFKILRVMQVKKPILLEGSPGVGKTTIVSALANAVGKKMVRVNLSDETDMMDLLGANLPISDGNPGEFRWSDGPLLSCMKEGNWVLLDELNLAEQSILEGLNALLDHRGELYIPELGRTVKAAPGFRLFGAQNPVNQGGGRKGLPKSFLNRFTRLQIESFTKRDLVEISGFLYPDIPDGQLNVMVNFLCACSTVALAKTTTGYEYDFNLRDLLRWCELICHCNTIKQLNLDGPNEEELLRRTHHSAQMIFCSRMRTSSHRTQIENLLSHNFMRENVGSMESELDTKPAFKISDQVLNIGHASLERSQAPAPLYFREGQYLCKSFFRLQEYLIECVNHNWAGILVGPAGSGKSSLITNLGHLSGHNVVEIQMHRGMDISDLLGGFEQQDKFRDAHSLIEQVNQLIRLLAFYCSDSELGLESIRALWEQILDCKERDPVLIAKIVKNESNMECLEKMIASLTGAHRTEAQVLFDSICRLASKLSLLKGCEGKFEWVDGTLTRCILEGSWVILRDANLCSPSLLDRLNPLLEPGGYLALNECCTETDGPRMIQPHVNFRLFITYDPFFGEISRAMKNRGIELYFAPETYLDGGSQALKGDCHDLSHLPGLISFPGVKELLFKWIQRFFQPVNKKVATLEILLRYFEIFSGLLLVGSSFKRTMLDFVDRMFWIESPLHLNGLEVSSLGQHSRLGEQNSIFLYPSISSVGDSSISSKLLSDLTFLMEILSPFIQHMISNADVEVNTVMNQIDPLMLPSLRSILCESFSIKRDDNSLKHGINAMRYFHTKFGFSLQIYAETCACNTHYARELEDLLGSLISYLKSLQNFGEARKTPNRVFEIESAMLQIPFTEWMQRYETETLSKMVVIELIELRILTVFETLPSEFSIFFSILECSAWVQKNPHARNTRLANFALLEWVWPTLQAIVAKAKEQEDLTKINHQGILFQDLLWLFIDYVHFDPSVAAISALDKNLERVAFAWSTLERYIQDNMPVTSSECRVHLQNFSNSLGFKSEVAQPNLKAALGAPQIPPSIEVFNIQHDILSYCSRIKFLAPDNEDSNDSDHNQVGIDPGDGAMKLQVLEGLTIIMAVNFGYGSHSLAILKDTACTIKSMKSIQRRSREVSEEQMVLEAMRANSLVLIKMQACISFDQIWPAQAARLDFDLINLNFYLTTAQNLIANSPGSNLTSALPYALMRKYVGSVQGRSIQEIKQDNQNIFDSLGNQIMIQFYRDLWSTVFCNTRDLHEMEGPHVLHCCGMLWVIRDLVKDNQLPSLRSEASRIQKLDCALKSIVAYNENGSVNLSKIEMKFAMSTLIVILDSLSSTCSVEVQSRVKSLALDSLLSSKEDHAGSYTLVCQVAKTAGKSAVASGILETCLVESANTLLLNGNVLCDTAAGINSRGKAISLLGLLHLKMVQPEQGFDPVLASKFEKEGVESILKQLYSAEESLRREYDNLPLSEKQGDRIRVLNERSLVLREYLNSVDSFGASRPEESHYLELLKEVDEFNSHLGRSDRIWSLVKRMDLCSGTQYEKNVVEEAKIWIKNSISFLKSLNRRYPHYVDIIGPMEVALHEVMYGLGLLVVSFQKAEQANRYDDLCRRREALEAAERCLTSIIIYPNAKSLPGISDIRALILPALRYIDQVPEEDLLCLSLEFCELKLDEIRESRDFLSTKQKDSHVIFELQNVMMEIYQRWQEIKDQEAQRSIAEESLFEMKTKVLDIFGEGISFASKFSVEFPDPSHAFDDLDLSFDDTPEEKCIENGNHRKEVGLIKAVTVQLKNTFEYLFNSDNQKKSFDSQTAYTKRIEFGLKLAMLIKFQYSSNFDQECASSYLYIMASLMPQFQLERESSNMSLNHSIPREVNLLREPLESMQKRLFELLHNWPDHPILEQLLKICNKILDLPQDRPLKEFSTGLELILSRAQIWEETASKNVTLGEYLAPLIALAVRWQRMELDSWQGLIGNMKDQIDSDMSFFLLYLYHFSLENDATPSKIGNLQEIVENSSVAQFGMVLQMLNSFANYLDFSSKATGSSRSGSQYISNILRNVHSYYEEYNEGLQEFLKKEIAPLEKDLHDFVLLAKWEDKGFYAMKTSKEANKKKLYKILKKIEDTFKIPASQVLQSKRLALGVDGLGDKLNRTKLIIELLCNPFKGLEMIKEISTDLKTIARAQDTSLGKYTQKLEKTTRKFKNLAFQSFYVLSDMEKIAKGCNMLAYTAAYRAKSLMDDTSKGSKARKKKALAHLFDEMEALGIAHLKTSIPRHARGDKNWAIQERLDVNGIIKFFENRNDNVKYDREQLLCINRYYFKSIDASIRIQQVSQCPHKDIQSWEVEKSIKMAMNLVYLNQFLRSRTERSFKSVMTFFQYMETIECGNIDLTFQQKVAYNSYITLQELLSSGLEASRRFLDYITVLQNVTVLNKDITDDGIILPIKTFIDSMATCYRRMHEQKEKEIAFTNGFFVSASSWRVLNECCLEISRAFNQMNMKGKVTGAIPGSRQWQLELDSIVSFAKSIENSSSMYTKVENQQSPAMMTKIEEMICSCLVWGQESSNLASSRESNITEAIDSLNKLLCIDSLERINSHLNECFACLWDSENFQSVYADILFQDCLPMLRVIGSKLRTCLDFLLGLQHSLSKLAYISSAILCTLIEKGFCTPEETDAAAEASTVTGGTGLGDGDTKDARDISHELENEDQMLGTEGQEDLDDNEPDNAELNDHPAGIEIEEDFQGKMEDISSNPEESGEDEEEQRDQQGQLEQEMGDVGNDGDNVDERLWDKDDDLDDKQELGDSQNKAEAKDTTNPEYDQGKNDRSDSEQDDDLKADQNDVKENESKDDGVLEADNLLHEEEYRDELPANHLEVEQNNLEFPSEMEIDDVNIEELNDSPNADEGVEEEIEEQGASIHEENTQSDAEGQNSEDLVDIPVDELNAKSEEHSAEGDAGEDKDKFDDRGSPIGDGNQSLMDQELGGEERGFGSKTGHELEGVDGDPNPGNTNQGDGKDSHTIDVPMQHQDQNNRNMNRVDVNPFHSLSEAAEKWKVHAGMVTKNDDDGDGREAEEQSDIPTQADDLSYRFMNEDEIVGPNDDALIADATKDQARDGMRKELENISLEQPTEEQEQDMEQERNVAEQDSTTDIISPASEQKLLKENKFLDTKSMGSDHHVDDYLESLRTMSLEKGTGSESAVSASLRQITEKEETIRENLRKKVKKLSSEGVEAKRLNEFGMDIWKHCQQLTEGLSSELAEQLRLILQPSVASKLGGEYRSGKRINMKRVINYIASNFRKDKIWMRRSIPDKRRYQVVLAIDNSKSMAETECGTFALEAMSLICSAMSKLDVGDLGIVRFGGSIGMQEIHPLGKPFQPAEDGPVVMSWMRFDQDNTINDQPMVDVLYDLDRNLAKEGMKALGGNSLQQLVIMLADGRFHEKDALQKAVRKAVSRPGVMYSFVILDNPKNSILDMKTVSFVEGKPIFAKYIDSFPFPLYIVLQDIQVLPRILSDLLRQWIEMSSSTSY